MNRTKENKNMKHEKGVFVQGFPFSVVPENTSRLRANVTSAHSTDEITYCNDVIENCGKEIGIIK